MSRVKATFTKGDGPLGPTYEKLRKQSWRKRQARVNLWTKWGFSAASMRQLRHTHETYVSGVKDALREVETNFTVHARVR